MSFKPIVLSPPKPNRLIPESGLLGVRSVMGRLIAILSTEFDSTVTPLSLLAETMMPMNINTNMTLAKMIPTMVASTNLKNCFIK